MTTALDDHRQSWPGSTPLTATEQRNLETIAAVAPCWNRHDVAGILAHYADDIRWRNMATGETFAGKDEVGSYLTELFAAVPDLTMTITRRIPRGDLVAEEYTLRGTHLGTLFGIAPTGRPVRIDAVSFVEMRDGLLSCDHYYLDVAGLLHQLGLFPPLSFTRTRVGRALMAVGVALRFPLRAGRLRRAART